MDATRYLEMQVDLSQRLTFPPEITIIHLQPDLVLRSKPINEAFEGKKLQDANCTTDDVSCWWRHVIITQINPTQHDIFSHFNQCDDVPGIIKNSYIKYLD